MEKIIQKYNALNSALDRKYNKLLTAIGLQDSTETRVFAAVISCTILFYTLGMIAYLWDAIQCEGAPILAINW